MNNAEFLRSLAQNDYMIDNHFLGDGAQLNELADALETAARNIRTLRAAYPEYDFGPQMWDSTLALIEGAADSAAREPFHDALCERRDANVYACCCDLRKSRRADSAAPTPHDNHASVIVQDKLASTLNPHPMLSPTHRCTSCGALWRQCDDFSMNLRSPTCCDACNNAPCAAGLIPLVADSADVCINCGRPDGTGPCRRCEFPPSIASLTP